MNISCIKANCTITWRLVYLVMSTGLNATVWQPMIDGKGWQWVYIYILPSTICFPILPANLCHLQWKMAKVCREYRKANGRWQRMAGSKEWVEGRGWMSNIWRSLKKIMQKFVMPLSKWHKLQNIFDDELVRKKIVDIVLIGLKS